MTDSTQNWAEVPFLVQDLYVKYANDARILLGGEANKPEGWVLDTEEVGPVLLKRAEGEGILPKVGDAWRTAQSFMGGPNPTTAMLLGGALAGGLGYGGGYLLHKLFPQWFNKRFAATAGIAGGIGGAGANFLLQGVPALQYYGPKGMFIQQPLQGGSYPKPGASSRFTGVLDRLTEKLGVSVDDEEFEKHAQRMYTSGAGGQLPQIPTDGWGRVVMRDPFLLDSEKAVAAGLVAGAGAMRGSRMVSPRDVATLAINAGLGAGYGYIGAIAARFMGLTNPVQKGIQRAGLLAGAIRGITGML